MALLVITLAVTKVVLLANSKSNFDQTTLQTYYHVHKTAVSIWFQFDNFWWYRRVVGEHQSQSHLASTLSS